MLTASFAAFHEQNRESPFRSLSFGVLGGAIVEAERTEERGGLDRVTCTEAAQKLYTSSLFHFSETLSSQVHTMNHQTGSGITSNHIKDDSFQRSGCTMELSTKGAHANTDAGVNVLCLPEQKEGLGRCFDVIFGLPLTAAICSAAEDTSKPLTHNSIDDGFIATIPATRK